MPSTFTLSAMDEDWAPFRLSARELAFEMKLHEALISRDKVSALEEKVLNIIDLFRKMDQKMERENHKALRNSICWRKIFSECVQDSKDRHRVIGKTPGDAPLESYWDIQDRLRLLEDTYYRNRFPRWVSGSKSQIKEKEAQDEYIAMWTTVQGAMRECLVLLDEMHPGCQIVRGLKLGTTVDDPSVCTSSKAVSRSQFLQPTWRLITGRPDPRDPQERFLEENWTHWSTKIDSNDEEFPSPESAFRGVRIPASVASTCVDDLEHQIKTLYSQGVSVINSTWN